jgi:tetratricopeptide (TPR) repeat protein
VGQTTAFAATPSLSLCAVGFANGTITLIRGDLIHDRGSKQRTIFESEEPITNLCFSPPNYIKGHEHHKHVARMEGGDTLYVATTARVLTLFTAGKGAGQPARVLESQGCGVGCMSPAVDFMSDERGLVHEGGDIVVARDDALYFYGPNGRGACYSYEGPKQVVKVYRNYISLISPPSSRPSTAVQSGRPRGVSDTLKRLVGKGSSGSDDPFETTKFTLLDTELKFIAHSERLISGVKEVFISWGDYFILSLDGKLHRYHEISLQEKLDILYARNLYVLAINLAERAKVKDSKLRGIYRRYADYQYGKGDYDGSMQWYIKALGPADEEGVSNVIRKFLDTQRIHNLIEYLEELHKHDSATSDHTTLLLNCYAKLKDIDKLEAFIKQTPEQGLKFDVDTAIAMCRQAGYYEQAVYLAEKQQEHDIVVSVMVENLERTQEALAYIQKLDPDTAYANIMKYARVFLQKVPEAVTDVLVEYYIGEYVPKKPEPQDSTGQTQQKEQDGKFQSYINTSLLQQLPYMGGASQSNTPTHNTGSPAKPGTQNATPEDGATIPLALPIHYTRPKPRTAFSSFVDHSKEFINFLEKILQHGESTGKLSESDRVDIYTTLFEIYLQRANDVKGRDEKRKWEAKAKKIIESREVRSHRVPNAGLAEPCST